MKSRGCSAVTYEVIARHSPSASGCGGTRRLSRQARGLIDNPGNELFFSPASLWEVVIKRGLQRPDFKVDPRVLRRGLLDNGYGELPIVSEHVVAIDSLPPI